MTVCFGSLTFNKNKFFESSKVLIGLNCWKLKNLFYKSTSHHGAIGAKIRHIAKFPILKKFSKKYKNNQFLINEILKLQKIKNRTFNYFNMWLKWTKMSLFWLNIHSSLVFGTKSQIRTGLKWKIFNLAQWNLNV